MRKQKTFYNMIGTISSYFITMIFNFITIPLIIKFLGIEYSGVNGLFTNIITMLSLVELGIGGTIVFKLYKPLAENDIEQIKSWMSFYKKCYRYIGIAVAIIGLLIIPIVPIIIGEVAIKENIIILYLICLFDVVSSYFLSFKYSLLFADQKHYITSIANCLSITITKIFQIILLFFVKSYTVYLLLKMFFRFVEHISVSYYVDKKYPYIKEPAQEISKEEKQNVYTRIKAIFLAKISNVINSGTDNIIISLFLGVVSVGYYSNYYLIVHTINTLLNQALSGTTASVGDLLTENNIEKSYDIFKKINMLNSFVTSIGIVGFLAAIQPFICIWLGEKYLLSSLIVISFGLYIYTNCIDKAICLFRDAAGIYKDRHMFVIMAIINIVASIILCKFIGIAGVIIGTVISRIFIIFCCHPIYTYKVLFKKKTRTYLSEYIKYFIYIVLSSAITITICRLIVFSNIVIQFLFNALLAITICILLFTLMFGKTNEFQYYINLLKRIFKKIIFKTKKN